MLIDSHCHLDFPDFADDLDAIVGRAEAAGIGRIVTISTRVRRLAGAARYRRAFPERLLLGRHPSASRRRGRRHLADELIELTRIPRWWRSAKRGSIILRGRLAEAQERGFRAHIAAARATGLPLVIHTREADEDCGRVLEDEMAKGSIQGRAALLHRRAGPCDEGDRAGAVDLVHRHYDLQEIEGVARARGRIAGRSHHGRNRRALSRAGQIPRQAQRAVLRGGVAKVLAETRGVSLEEISRQTTENFFRLFSKVPAVRSSSRVKRDADADHPRSGSSAGVPRPALGWGACNPAIQKTAAAVARCWSNERRTRARRGS